MAAVSSDRSLRGGAGWRRALMWGLGVALAHRLVLTLWMALVWLLFGAQTGHAVDSHNTPIAALPALSSPLEELAFGVWRRWDVVEYLNLAQNGYRATDPHASVYGPLAPLVIRLLDVALPGPLDLAGMVFGTAAFALALVMLYRVVEVAYGDPDLAPYAVVATALLPLSYFLTAPMSDAIYLALVLGMFYAASQERWWLMGVCGFLATLARTQGVLLTVVAGVLALEMPLLPSREWRTRLVKALRRTWPLALIPLGYAAFTAYRRSVGLPPLVQTYHQASYHFFVNPLEGLIINLRWLVRYPLHSLTNVDFLAMLLVPPLTALLGRYPLHRRLSAIVYCVASYLVFISKINWRFGTQEVLYSISVARYALTLFPLTVLLADLYRRLGQGRNGWHRSTKRTSGGRRIGPRFLRLLMVGMAFGGLLIFSAAHALGAGPN